MPHGLGHCLGYVNPRYDAAEQCRVCWLAAKRPVFGPLPAQVKPACIHLGPLVSACELGDAMRDVHHCLCDDASSSRCWRSALRSTDADIASCQRCPHYDDGVPVPAAGVVIGSYGLPNLIALQVAMIRDHCGSVPILIVDDCSDGYGHTPSPSSVCGKLRAIAVKNENVFLFQHPTRFGHASGDLSKLWTGLQWAKVHGLKVLAALSQRFLIDRKKWLQDGAKALVASGLPVSSQPCNGRETFPMRTEAMLLDVEKWHTPAILDHLMPRQVAALAGQWGVAAEIVVWDDVRDRLGGKMHSWGILNQDRYNKHPGIVWHCCNSVSDYAALAKRYSLELDAGFTTAGWRQHQGKAYKG